MQCNYYLITLNHQVTVSRKKTVRFEIATVNSVGQKIIGHRRLCLPCSKNLP